MTVIGDIKWRFQVPADGLLSLKPNSSTVKRQMPVQNAKRLSEGEQTPEFPFLETLGTNFRVIIPCEEVLSAKIILHPFPNLSLCILGKGKKRKSKGS